jgi:hypothetical protein
VDATRSRTWSGRDARPSRSPGDREQERGRNVGGVVGEDVGRIGNGQAPRLCRSDVDVVEAHTEVRNDPGLERIRREDLGRQLVGDRRQDAVRGPQDILKSRGIERAIFLIELYVE